MLGVLICTPPTAIIFLSAEELCKWNCRSSKIMKNQMKNKYCLDEKDWQRAKAALTLAKNFGLIPDDTVEALEERRKEKNEENRHKQEKGELFYGPYFYTPPMYLQYELTRFRLDFVQPSEKIKQLGVCPSFTREERLNFYENNHDLFGRYHGDYFHHLRM